MPSTRVIPLPASTAAVYSYDFQITKKISNCNHSKRTLTGCIWNFFEKQFGSDYKTLIEKSINQTMSIFGGTDHLQRITGCQKLCNFVNYDFNLIHIESSDNILDGKISTILEETNFSSLFTLIHVPKSAVLQNEEVPYYTFITFLSDVGGIMGIFMGLSLLSLYSMCIAPITRKIDGFMSREKQNS